MIKLNFENIIEIGVKNLGIDVTSQTRIIEYYAILKEDDVERRFQITKEQYQEIKNLKDKEMFKLNLKELIENIQGWSKERELDTQDPKLQTLKLMEEVGELSASLLRDKKDELLDSLGDVLVVLVILHQQLGFNLEDSLNVAWNEIKDRNGKIIDGVFVKESDYK